MCIQNQKIANTGIATISTANPNLDGTGAMSLILTGGSKGTRVDNIIIKATGSTSQGMVRLFTSDGVNKFLYKEIVIPEILQTNVVKAFQVFIDDDLVLDSGYELYASTQKAEAFNILANGISWDNCECSQECTCSDPRFEGHTGIVNIATANSNLNGSGALGNVITATNSAVKFYGGTSVMTVNIKATGSTTQGMVRLFVSDSITKYLISEIPIPATTQTGIEPSFRTNSYLGIVLPPRYELWASTQNAESFNVITDACDIVNCECI